MWVFCEDKIKYYAYGINENLLPSMANALTIWKDMFYTCFYFLNQGDLGYMGQ
jgi:hypothetical protein